MGVSQDRIQTLEDGIKRDGIQRVVVGAVVRRDDLVLLLKRQPDDFMGGLVELPSGTIDPGEEIVEALKREIQEETGLKVESLDSFIGTLDYASGSGKKTRQLNFLTRVQERKVRLNSAEHTEYYWLNPNAKDFQLLSISEKTRQTIEKAFAQIPQ